MWKCFCEGRARGGDKWPEIMSGDKSSSDVTSPGHQTLARPLLAPVLPLLTLETENTLNTEQTMFSCLTLFFHWNKKGTFPFLIFLSLCCLSNVLPPIVDTVFRLLMTLCPHNTSVNVIDLNSARIPSSWHSSVFSRGCFVFTVFTVLTCSSSLVASVQSYYFATPLHSCSSIHSVLQCSHSRQSQNLMPFKSFKVVTFEQVLGFDDGDSDGIIIILRVLESS